MSNCDGFGALWSRLIEMHPPSEWLHGGAGDRGRLQPPLGLLGRLRGHGRRGGGGEWIVISWLESLENGVISFHRPRGCCNRSSCITLPSSKRTESPSQRMKSGKYSVVHHFLHLGWFQHNPKFNEIQDDPKIMPYATQPWIYALGDDKMIRHILQCRANNPKVSFHTDGIMEVVFQRQTLRRLRELLTRTWTKIYLKELKK